VVITKDKYQELGEDAVNAHLARISA